MTIYNPVDCVTAFPNAAVKKCQTALMCRCARMCKFPYDMILYSRDLVFVCEIVGTGSGLFFSQTQRCFLFLQLNFAVGRTGPSGPAGLDRGTPDRELGGCGHDSVKQLPLSRPAAGSPG